MLSHKSAALEKPREPASQARLPRRPPAAALCPSAYRASLRLQDPARTAALRRVPAIDPDLTSFSPARATYRAHLRASQHVERLAALLRLRTWVTHARLPWLDLGATAPFWASALARPWQSQRSRMALLWRTEEDVRRATHEQRAGVEATGTGRRGGYIASLTRSSSPRG